ncbi:MAG: hypothetical protein ACYC3X_03075 [Pirellulaceae bacterium]
MPHLHPLPEGFTIPRSCQRGNWQRTIARAPVVAALVAALSGCGSEEAVRHYRVPKPELLHAENHVEKAAEPAADPLSLAQPTDRLLGAIVPHGAQTWYFKMMGPLEAVASQDTAFRSLIESLRFENELAPPQWTLPPSWQEKAKSGERVATLAVDVDGQTLEVSVIPLATGPAPDSLLNNVNRWRGQMQLPPIAADQLPNETITLDLPGGQATLVNLVGTAQSGGMGNTARQLGSSAPAINKEPAAGTPQ